MLNKNGQIFIFSLKTKKNEIPCFKIMKSKLLKSLQRDEDLIKVFPELEPMVMLI